LNQSSDVIGGLTIPAALIDAFTGSRWAVLAGSPKLEELVGQRTIRPVFFTFEIMTKINKSWHRDNYDAYKGQPSATRPPGDIDPLRSLLIGEIGPDQPIAIDYRQVGEPCVVFATDDTVSPWIIIAESIDTLLQRLSEN
jgi:hypothetical protein